MGPLVMAPQLATGLGVLAGAVIVKAAVELGRRGSMAGGEGWPRCPTCNGSGRMECFCSRWSDGDVGCRTCSGSGRMACQNCGGTGTGRPIPAQLRIQPSNRPP